MARSKWPWLCCIAALALTAQTPAPQPAAATPGKPIRHLQFAFHADYNSSFGGGGGRGGTMTVDIVGFSPDGALIANVREELDEAPRPGERFTCTIYGDGHVMCPTADGPLTDAENVLLSTLGRGFVQATPANGGAWKRSYDGKQIAAVTDYTLKDPGDGAPAIILKHSKITSRVPAVGDSVEDAKIIYDRAMSVPDTIHDVLYENTNGSGVMQSVIDFRLMQDSFARHQ